MSFYDQAARFAAKIDPDGFLHWLLSGLAPGWRFAGWLDTQTIPFPGDPIAAAIPWRGWTTPTAWRRRGRSWSNCKPGTILPCRIGCWNTWCACGASCGMGRTAATASSWARR